MHSGITHRAEPPGELGCLQSVPCLWQPGAQCSREDHTCLSRLGMLGCCSSGLLVPFGSNLLPSAPSAC